MLDRIYIIGNSASGKSSLAKKLSGILKIKSYDLDDFFWEKRFTKKRDRKEAEKLVKEVTGKQQWIIEGVYSSCKTCSLDRADLIIWLDYPFRIIAWRLIRRQLKKGEKLSMLLDFLHYARDYYKKPEHKHWERNESNYYKHKKIVEAYRAQVVHVKNKNELEAFLRKISHNSH